MPLIKIKAVMLETGLTRKALRYYDEKNLVKATKIDVGKNRAWYYTEEDVTVLKRIKLYRELDISVKQIKIIINSENGEDIFNEKIVKMIAGRKEELRRQAELAKNISLAINDKVTSECPIDK